MQDNISHLWSHKALGASKLKARLSSLEPVGHVHREAKCGSLSAGEGKFGKTLGRPQRFLSYSVSLAKQHWVQ